MQYNFLQTLQIVMHRKLLDDLLEISYIHIYMKSRKIVQTILHTRQQRRHTHKEQTFGLHRRRRGWDDLREYH